LPALLVQCPGFEVPLGVHQHAYQLGTGPSDASLPEQQI